MELPTVSNQDVTPSPPHPPPVTQPEPVQHITPTPVEPSPITPTARRKSLETPGRRLIPPRDPIPSQISSSDNNSPAIPERNVRRSAEFVPAPLQVGQGAFPPPPPPGDKPAVNYSRPANKSTFANLKSAAAGIHGAGETLRGTLNSSVDKHFGGTPQAIEKNQAAIDAGRYEIDNRTFYHPNEYRLTRPEGSGPSPTGLQFLMLNTTTRPSTWETRQEVLRWRIKRGRRDIAGWEVCLVRVEDGRRRNLVLMRRQERRGGS
ncbi:hypothetical protein FoTM2_012362 [Fusarium oxysporum f. sp. vasinfectum]|nr:hypothetical protein FoTM2_012362 [Fusarium oxysporum f. sp. vasinfectum]